jgi:hypothetical protein
VVKGRGQRFSAGKEQPGGGIGSLEGMAEVEQLGEFRSFGNFGTLGRVGQDAFQVVQHDQGEPVAQGALDRLEGFFQAGVVGDG